MHIWLFNRKNLLALVMGPIDGILTALTLAAGSVVRGHESIDSSFAFRIGIASSLSGAFVFFAAQYLQLRSELRHAEEHLVLRKHGQLAASMLGRIVIQEAMVGAAITGILSFIGASLPLLFVAVLPIPTWSALLVAVCLLALLGILMGWAVEGNKWRWSLSMVATGILLALAGMALHVA